MTSEKRSAVSFPYPSHNLSTMLSCFFVFHFVKSNGIRCGEYTKLLELTKGNIYSLLV